MTTQQHRARLALMDAHARTLGNGCPCLLQWGTDYRVQIVAGTRTISWECSHCGGFNSETEAYPPKHSVESLHVGGPRGPASDSLMAQQYEARP